MELQLPTCALIGNRGTVILRLRDMECEGCRRTGAYARQCTYQPLDKVCELCTRTSYSKISDCDSDYNERWRKYKAASAKSRYVNVCAAVCLLLVVGTTAPGTHAAALRAADPRTMDMKQREYLWENPCDYSENQNKQIIEYSPSRAQQLAKQAERVYKRSSELKDDLACDLHSFDKYEDLILQWQKYEWIRQLPWYEEDVLPRSKHYNQLVPEEQVTQLVDDKARLDKALPLMVKTLKLVVASLDHMETEGLNSEAFIKLKGRITLMKHDIRDVLCECNILLSSRNLPMTETQFSSSDYDSFPNFRSGSSEPYVTMMLIYRDSLDFLEYLHQVFQTMYDHKV